MCISNNDIITVTNNGDSAFNSERLGLCAPPPRPDQVEGHRLPDEESGWRAKASSDLKPHCLPTCFFIGGGGGATRRRWGQWREFQLVFPIDQEPR